jgi:hypothetical protein
LGEVSTQLAAKLSDKITSSCVVQCTDINIVCICFYTFPVEEIGGTDGDKQPYVELVIVSLVHVWFGCGAS